MPKNNSFDKNYAQSQIDRQNNWFRKLIKHFYLKRILNFIEGPTVDLGCGAGQLLQLLPKDSVGIEINPSLVDYQKKRGLNVIQAPLHQNYIALESLIEPDKYQSLVLSHVLEHFDDADKVLQSLLQECNKLGISTIILVVPGLTGFKSDNTHKTFVNMDYLISHNVTNFENYKITHSSYFPGNIKQIGKVFIYHELMVVYKKIVTNNT